MILKATVSDHGVRAALRGFEQAYDATVATALRETARDGQKLTRTKVRQYFTIAPSRVTFIERLIKIEEPPGAADAELAALGITLRVAAPNASAKSGDASRVEGLLTRHEEGGTHTSRAFFLPSPVLRPTQTSDIPRAMYPKALGLVDGKLLGKVRTLSGQKTTKKALKQQGLTGIGGTFMIPPAPGVKGGIFQRTGSGIRLLWSFAQKIHLSPRLRFEQTINESAQASWPKAAERAVRLTLRKLGVEA